MFRFIERDSPRERSSVETPTGFLSVPNAAGVITIRSQSGSMHRSRGLTALRRMWFEKSDVLPPVLAAGFRAMPRNSISPGPCDCFLQRMRTSSLSLSEAARSSSRSKPMNLEQ